MLFSDGISILYDVHDTSNDAKYISVMISHINNNSIEITNMLASI